jgi:hypothetical protein
MLAVSGFSYEFYTGLTLYLSFERQADSKLNLDFQLGSLLNVQFSSELQGLTIGVNLLAIAVLIYMFSVVPVAIPERAARALDPE